MRRDILTGTAAGLLIGILLLPILPNIATGTPIAALIALPAYQAAIVIGITVASAIATALGAAIGRHLPVIAQIVKFSIVGALNTFVDLGILNLLIHISGISSGVPFSLFKGLSFSVAVVNSYAWNASWTFKKRIVAPAAPKRFLQFFLVSVIGLVINVGAASGIVNGIAHPSYVTPEQWANVGALVATVASLAWNFLGYKFIVFR